MVVAEVIFIVVPRPQQHLLVRRLTFHGAAPYAPFAEVHREVLHLFPSQPCSVLDIGAGSGRDAAALAARGHRVVAAEPTAEPRSLGRRLHSDQKIEWVDDALPRLTTLTARGGRFDLILLTAVWMHLDDNAPRPWSG
ncbi:MULTISPECIES: class I SAM-dependent methyltransferase [unclassified Streptomyces]|uniref:class I SAM-dependent methyltransferase n=1 Tax=unclassified Streptomyces TaxID=2593676 RepID=UPI0036538859